MSSPNRSAKNYAEGRGENKVDKHKQTFKPGAVFDGYVVNPFPNRRVEVETVNTSSHLRKLTSRAYHAKNISDTYGGKFVAFVQIEYKFNAPVHVYPKMYTPGSSRTWCKVRQV